MESQNLLFLVFYWAEPSSLLVSDELCVFTELFCDGKKKPVLSDFVPEVSSSLVIPKNDFFFLHHFLLFSSNTTLLA